MRNPYCLKPKRLNLFHHLPPPLPTHSIPFGPRSLNRGKPSRKVKQPSSPSFSSSLPSSRLFPYPHQAQSTKPDPPSENPPSPPRPRSCSYAYFAAPTRQRGSHRLRVFAGDSDPDLIFVRYFPSPLLDASIYFRVRRRTLVVVEAIDADTDIVAADL